MEERAATFGEWLRDRLFARDINARQFALSIRVSHTAVNNWLTGKTKPRKAQMAKIAAGLKTHEHEVWDAFRELPPAPYTDLTLSRLLELPPNLTEGQMILVKHLFRAVLAYEEEMESRGRGSGGRRRA